MRPFRFALLILASVAFSLVFTLQSLAQWVPTSGPSHDAISCLLCVGSDLLAGTSTGNVFRSTNGGGNWFHSDSGLVGSYVQKIILQGGTLVAATDSGVFISTNIGRQWSGVGGGLPRSFAYTVAAHGVYLFAGTYDGVWKRPLSEVVTEVYSKLPSVPSSYDLAQNYPNPFNPSTTIRYGLSQRSHVTLIVFNTLGQAVATLVNETQDAGYHDVRFDASGLASEVYFCRLTAGDYLATKRLLLLR